MRKLLTSSVPLCVLVALLGSGCAWTDLKEANQRYKESRDRLVAENNRLDSELKAARQEVQLLQAEIASRGAPAPAPAPAPETRLSQNPAPRREQNTRNDLILPGIDEKDPIAVTQTAQGIKLTVPHQVFFASGQAKLSSRGQGVLRKIASILNQPEFSGSLVRVEGHTDDTPIRKIRHLYPTNWELSTARACTVVRYLVDRAGVGSGRIYPAGFAATRPRAAGRTVSARSKNRRVEIMILNQSA